MIDSINRRMATVLDKPIGPRLKSGLFVQWRKTVPLFISFDAYSAAYLATLKRLSEKSYFFQIRKSKGETK